jgi:hypothetical protein
VLRTTHSEDYFNWLCSYIDPDQCNNIPNTDIDFSVWEFRKLLRKLHSTRFYSLVDNDENRAIDGVALRTTFFEETGMRVGDLGDCTVFEMMVGLTRRYIEDFVGTNYNTRVRFEASEWFYMMLQSLGLDGQDNSAFHKGYVDDILKRFLNREYEPEGRGGLFTLNCDDRDLRNIEIWYQMQLFLDEWYYNMNNLDI